MEASLSYLKELFALGNTDIKTYSPLTLAYIGDAVYEIVIRTILVEKGMHKLINCIRGQVSW